MTFKLHKLLPVSAAVMALAALSASNTAAADQVVKIGHVGPLTGGSAHLGKDNENGARLAIDDANAKGVVIDGKKIKFELDAQDDQADPKVGVQVAQNLVDHQVVAVMGPYNSGVAIPASRVYNSAGVPILPVASNPALTTRTRQTITAEAGSKCENHRARRLSNR